jgi:hypothetical protein
VESIGDSLVRHAVPFGTHPRISSGYVISAGMSFQFPSLDSFSNLGYDGLSSGSATSGAFQVSHTKSLTHLNRFWTSSYCHVACRSFVLSLVSCGAPELLTVARCPAQAGILHTLTRVTPLVSCGTPELPVVARCPAQAGILHELFGCRLGFEIVSDAGVCPDAQQPRFFHRHNLDPHLRGGSWSLGLDVVLISVAWARPC